MMKKALCLLALLVTNLSIGSTTQHHQMGSNGVEDEANPLLDMASIFIQEALNNQNNNGRRDGGGSAASLAGIASIVGSFMQANSGGQAKSSGGSGAMQILSGLGSLLANSNNNGKRSGGGSGFDPSIIGNVLEMFTQSDDHEEDENNDREHHQTKRAADAGIDLSSILQIASAFMNQNNDDAPQHHQQKRSINANTITKKPQEDNSLMNLLPLVIQAATSFAGPEGKHTQEKHKDHAWVLPPFLEHLHVLWDHFSNSDLADALYEKSGVNKIVKVYEYPYMLLYVYLHIYVYIHLYMLYVNIFMRLYVILQ